MRAIDASRFGEIMEQWKKDCLADNDTQGADIISDVILQLDDMPTLTPPNEWVSVDNKLPKNGVPVLIGNPHWDYPVVASCAGYGVWMDSWHQKMTFTPTCWMPLPAPFNRRPPEGEANG